MSCGVVPYLQVQYSAVQCKDNGMQTRPDSRSNGSSGFVGRGTARPGADKVGPTSSFSGNSGLFSHQQ